MIQELVFATNNLHKLEEVQAMVGQQFIIKSLKEIGCDADIPETGITFEENAKQKTDYLIKHYDKDCFADDSGLEVIMLNKEPGVYSARYSGTRDMGQNIDLVLQKMKNQQDRRAQFVSVISLFYQGNQYFFEGIVYGDITYEEKGVGGFGYDGIFVPKGYEKTFAEMNADEKNSISHRGIAVQKLVDFLMKNSGN